MSTMRAAVYSAFSGPIVVQEVQKPTAPAGGLLLRVKAPSFLLKKSGFFRNFLDSRLVEFAVPTTTAGKGLIATL